MLTANVSQVLWVLFDLKKYLSAFWKWSKIASYSDCLGKVIVFTTFQCKSVCFSCPGKLTSGEIPTGCTCYICGHIHAHTAFGTVMVACSGGDTTDACLDWAKTLLVFLQVLIKRPLKVGLMIFSIELPHSYHYRWPRPTFKVTLDFERSSKIIVFQFCHQCVWVSRVFPLFILWQIMKPLFFFSLVFSSCASMLLLSTCPGSALPTCNSPVWKQCWVFHVGFAHLHHCMHNSREYCRPQHWCRTVSCRELKGTPSKETGALTVGVE